VSLCQNGRFVGRSVEGKWLVSPHDVSEERLLFNSTNKNHVTQRPSTEIRVVFGKGLTFHGSCPSPYIRPIAVLVKILLVSANCYWCQQILSRSYPCAGITISTNTDKCRHYITTLVTAVCFNTLRVICRENKWYILVTCLTQWVTGCKIQLAAHSFEFYNWWIMSLNHAVRTYQFYSLKMNL
jgi:hypothetical protein